MNKVILMGRLTKDPELKSTSNGVSRATFTVAVDRRFKSASGERETDFINCVAWRQNAEFVSRYFTKGQKMSLVGSLQVRTWDDQQGKRNWITEVIVDEVYFAESKSESSNNNYNNNNNSYSNNNNSYNSGNYTSSSEGFFEAPDDDTQLPFDL